MTLRTTYSLQYVDRKIFLWAGEDLNLHEFPHMLLRHARLPFRHPPQISFSPTIPNASENLGVVPILQNLFWKIGRPRKKVTDPRLERGTPTLKV